MTLYRAGLPCWNLTKIYHVDLPRFGLVQLYTLAGCSAANNQWWSAADYHIGMQSLWTFTNGSLIFAQHANYKILVCYSLIVSAEIHIHENHLKMMSSCRSFGSVLVKMVWNWYHEIFGELGNEYCESGDQSTVRIHCPVILKVYTILWRCTWITWCVTSAWCM